MMKCWHVTIRTAMCSGSCPFSFDAFLQKPWHLGTWPYATGSARRSIHAAPTSHDSSRSRQMEQKVGHVMCEVNTGRGSVSNYGQTDWGGDGLHMWVVDGAGTGRTRAEGKQEWALWDDQLRVKMALMEHRLCRETPRMYNPGYAIGECLVGLEACFYTARLPTHA